jgi:opacity protein-like surface antigen
MNRHCRALAAIATLLLAAAPAAATAQATPATGIDVLQRMHDAYAGKWYRTLTFVQKTTAYRNGTPTISTWYESLRHTDPRGTQLRIDTGSPSAGNGMLYTTDSSWVMRAGALTQTRPQGNEFLPMIEGVYMQPVSRTAEQVKALGVNMNRVMRGQWDGRPVWIVGAAAASDTTSTQFWVDTERNVVVRMIMGSTQPAAPPMDIHLDGYVPLAGGWLASKVSMFIGGAPRQIEEYRDWKANMDLAPGLFDPATWSTAPHWAPPR